LDISVSTNSTAASDTAADAYAQALRDVRAEILDVTVTLGDGAEAIYADDVRQSLSELSLHNPYTEAPSLLEGENGHG
jgi:hypothetical protein